MSPIFSATAAARGITGRSCGQWNGRHLEALVGGLRHMAPGAGGD